MKEIKCKCCKRNFKLSKYNQHNQKYCSASECRKASKKASDQKYRNSKKGSEKFKKKEVNRVQEWRRKNPSYSRKNKKISKVTSLLHEIVLREKRQDYIALHEMVILLDTKLKGLASLTFGALHETLDKIYKEMYIRGQELSSGVDSKISNLKNKEFGHEQRINSCKS